MEKSFVVKDLLVLDFYSDKIKPQLENYCLLPEQLNYTAYPMDAVEESAGKKERYPIVILLGRIPVGFFVLHERDGVKPYTDNRKALLLRAYSIDNRYQGRGFAKQSLTLLSSFIQKHFPGKNEIILAVNHRNTLAQCVYKKSGFVDKGIRRKGRKGELFILSKEI